MTENILVINVHSSRNLGDAALLSVTIQKLSESFPDCKITISMDDADSHQGHEKVVDSIVSWTHPRQPDGTVHWNYLRLIELLPCSLLPILTYRLWGKPFYAITPRKLKLSLEAYLAVDLVISGPGGFIYSSGLGISLLITVYSILIAAWAGKPVYILPQSIGPLKRGWEKKLVKWLLNKVRIVMVREPISLRLVQEIGVDQEHVYLIPDLAFAMPKSNQADGKEWLEKNGVDFQVKKPLLGMTMINWVEQHRGFYRQQAYEEACATAIRWFIENTGGKVILFPQVFGPLVSQDDRVPARRVVNQLPEFSSSMQVVEAPLPLDLLKSVYSWMDILIGTRMHSNIFALTEGVAVIMIGYLPKTRGMAEMLGIDQWCLDISQVEGNLLVERLKELWETKLFWDADNKIRFDKMIHETQHVGEKVRDDYLRLKQAGK